MRNQEKEFINVCMKAQNGNKTEKEKTKRKKKKRLMWEGWIRLDWV